MKLIDLHCDTISKMIKEDQNILENNLNISIPAMRKAETAVQLFACFTNLSDFSTEEGYDAAYRHVHKMIDCMEEQEKLCSSEIQIARSYDDIMGNNRAGRISAVLTVEEGGVLNGEMERLDELYERGIRLITPMWNYENCLGYPNSRKAAVMQKGLKPFGKGVLEKMGEMKMIVDVSHASDGSFWDIINMATCPVIASHSNCRALCAHPRNMNDEMIRALAEKGGV
ncbi:MAG: dipeptidase, partial [Dorea sp.]